MKCKKKEKEAETEIESELIKFIGNYSFSNSSINFKKSKNRNLYKNKNLKNELLSLKFSERKNISSSSLKNFTNLKHISCIKRVNSSDHSRNKNSTNYSDLKSNSGHCKLNSTKKLRLDDEDLLYNAEISLNESNNSFNVTRKKNENKKCFIKIDEKRAQIIDHEKNLDNNCIEKKSYNELSFNSNSNEPLCLLNAEGMYNKDKKENFLEIDMNDDLEDIDNYDTNKFNLNIFIKCTLLNPSFILLVISTTSYYDIVQNFLVYGAPILYSLNVYPSYEISILTCSISSCFSSIVGTLLGGYILNLYGLNIQNIDKKYEHMKNDNNKVILYNKDITVLKYIRIIGLQTTIILFFTSIFILILPFIHNYYTFTTLLTIGLTLLFASVPSYEIGAMVCAPNNIRAFSMGMASFIAHLFGDVLWAVLTGKIKSVLSPDCYLSRNEKISPLCREQSWGLKMTLLVICSKTLIMGFGSFFLYLYANRRIKKYLKIST